MSRGGATRPRGTLERSPVDIEERLYEAAAEAVERALEKARRMAYERFGVNVEPYIGWPELGDRFARWYRVAVKVDGLPPLNLVQPEGKPAYFALVAICPRCESLLDATVDTFEGLAQVRDAPEQACTRCRQEGRGRVTVNLWTATVEEEVG